MDNKSVIFLHFVVHTLLFLYFHSPTPPYTPEAEEDEGDAEQLTHVEEHAVLEIDLVLLGVLDEDAGGEDEEEAEAEEETRADLLRLTAIEVPVDEEEQGVTQSLVELARMARKHIYAFEDESPGHVGGPADDFGVHEVAHADGTGTDGRDDGDVVEHPRELQARLAHEEPEGDDEAQRAAVAGQSFVACVVPRTVGPHLGRHNHFQHVGGAAEEVIGLVEQAVAQSGTNQDAKEAVEHERVELLVTNALFLVEPVLQQIDTKQADGPAQGVPAHSERPDVERKDVGVPINIQQIYHILLLRLRIARIKRIYSLFTTHNYADFIITITITRIKRIRYLS